MAQKEKGTLRPASGLSRENNTYERPSNGISLRSGEAEMKILQRSGQAHFLRASSPDSSEGSLRFQIRSLPLARVLPNVSLLAGYSMCILLLYLQSLQP